jgi:hypothetical protein
MAWLSAQIRACAVYTSRPQLLWRHGCRNHSTLANVAVPNLFSLAYPWQPISIIYTLRISKMFLINTVAVISSLYVEVCAFFPPLSNVFSRIPVCPGFTPGGTRASGWESLA